MATSTTLNPLEEIVAAIPDPELPHVTIGELGMVRGVSEHAGQVVVTITPTYTGCPATEVIRQSVVEALHEHGYREVIVRMTLTPPWTTAWISEAGREKLRRAGIAPPPEGNVGPDAFVALPPACPRCGSIRTRKLGDFGATACKAPYVCQSCSEPFEQFKPI